MLCLEMGWYGIGIAIYGWGSGIGLCVGRCWMLGYIIAKCMYNRYRGYDDACQRMNCPYSSNQDLVNCAALWSLYR